VTAPPTPKTLLHGSTGQFSGSGLGSRALRWAGRQIRALQWRRLERGAPRLLTLATANGRLTVSTGYRLMAQRLYVGREYESYLIDSAIAELRRRGMAPPNGTALDIGANIGVIGIALVLRSYAARVIAVEPEASNYELLLRNVRQNALTDAIQCERVALGATDGPVLMELSPDNWGDHRVRGPLGGAPGEYDESSRATVTVPASTLDGLLDRAGPAVGPLSLIWMDVQGFEGHVLAGGARTIREGVPVVAEFWPYGIRRSGMDRDRFCRIVESLFRELVVLGGDPIARPIGELQVMFDQLVSSTRHRNILLLP
jgi:FkbM family methyltransferase